MAKNKTKKIITAGSLVIEAVYPRRTPRDDDRARAAKQKLSSEAQKRMNQIYSWQKLELMLAANFRPGDLVVTLTYDDAHYPADRKSAELRLKYFRRQLTAHRLMTGQDMVMIWNTEHKHGDGRWHHHAAINATGEDYDTIRRLWIYGSDVEIQPLRVDKEKDYETLARYMCKEEGDRLGQRKWSYTRNARKPEVETFRVESDTTVEVPEGAVELRPPFSDGNRYGSCKVIKYLAPGWERRPRVRARRRGSSRRRR